MNADSTQLGFDALLASADAANGLRELDSETAHLPSTMDEAISFYRGLIERHHHAMLNADEAETFHLRIEARKLAVGINRDDPAIPAEVDWPGRALERETTAPVGTPPLWGQSGDFRISLGDMPVRIRMDGMLGIGTGSGFWPGFSAHAVDYARPFLNETGYRSFLDIHADIVPQMTPETFAQEIVRSFVERQLKGHLVPIRPGHTPEP
jgi:hypothetical protein